MRYKLGFDSGYQLFREVNQKADRLGVYVSEILRVALTEYLERNPKDNEQEELKKYAATKGR